MQCKEVIKHVATRFLSLGCAVERVFKIWPDLKSHFLKFHNEWPCLIENIIASEEEEKKTSIFVNCSQRYVYMKCIEFARRSSKV